MSRAGAHSRSVVHRGLHILGEPDLLRGPLLAVLASRETPAELYLPFLDRLAETFSEKVICGGFRSDAEQAALSVALSQHARVVIFPPRDTRQLTPTETHLEAIRNGRLALASPTSMTGRRSSRAEADIRDNALLSHVAGVLVPAASRGGRVFDFCRRALELRIPVECLPHGCNADLILMGAEPCSVTTHL